jgi:hypothetical protein
MRRVRTAFRKRKPFPRPPSFMRNQGFYGTLFRKMKSGAEAMKWKILAVIAALGALSVSVFAQSEPPKELDILSNNGKSSEIPEPTRKQIHKALAEENAHRNWTSLFNSARGFRAI